MKNIQIISASAGSGKTTRLSHELERAVTVDGVHPDAILATTFTRKAAAELLERGRTALLVAGRLDEAERFGAARIGTVNAVCGRLVEDFAFELGVSPELDVLDEKRADEAFKRCLSEVVAKEEQARLTEIGKRFYEFDWQKAVRRVVDLARTNSLDVSDISEARSRSSATYAALLGEPTGTADEIDDALVEALENFIAGVEKNQETGTDTTSGTADALAEARRSLHDMKALGYQEWRRWVKLSKLKTRKKSEDLLPPLHEAAERVHGHPQLIADGSNAIDLVFELAARALAAYQNYKKERRALDFVDQEALALRLLRLPGIKDRLKEDISLVLVDEFQDTSPIQLAIFLELADVADRCIWVGDQKQAIYGFRGTDPALMDAAVDEILQGKEPVTLDKSWRSRPELVRLTSDLFVSSFAQQGLPESRVRLEPGIDSEPSGLGHVVERWTLKSKNQPDDAKALAACVQQFLSDQAVQVRDQESGNARAVAARDVAVLCRRRKMCQMVAAELAAVGIPAVLPRTGLLNTLEGEVLFAGLRLWADPRDSLAAAELARAVTFADDPDAWLKAAVEAPRAAAFLEAEPLCALLSEREKAPHAGPLAAFDAVVRTLDMRELCLRWGLSEQRLANLDAFRAHVFAFVERAQSDGITATPTALVGQLVQLAGEGEDSQAVVGGDHAVTVSTWHGSKGLEWPVTVLFQLEKDPIVAALGVHVASDVDEVDFADPLKGRWLRYWPNPFHPNHKDTPFHQRLGQTDAVQQAEQREHHQELRLLYVGWTRARDRVVVAGRGSLRSGILGFMRNEEGTVLEAPKYDGTTSEVDVTWAGRSVSLRERLAAPTEAPPSLTEPDSSFALPPPSTFPPASLAPSDVHTEGELGDAVTLGKPVEVALGFDMQHFGNAVHGFFGADLPTLDAQNRAAIASGLLARWQVEGTIPPETVLELADRLRSYVDQAWPNAFWHREWPIEHALDGGTVLRGSADLVLETADGFVIIDHKSFPGVGEAALSRAKTYAGQLAAYASAVEAARRRPVLGQYVHMPVAGLLVSVSASQEASDG